MKPYFAKYLPVEGEIKEGDKTLLKKKDGTFAIFTRKKEDDPEGWGQMTIERGHIPLQLDELPSYVQYTHPKGLKKHKLFLCSRDIQVGDKWFCLGNSLSGIVTNERVAYSVNNEHHIRIIGEISPEATWVKEGDEFDTTQIALGCGRNNFILQDVIDKNPWDIKESRWNEYEIRIKGQCDHFH